MHAWVLLLAGATLAADPTDAAFAASLAEAWGGPGRPGTPVVYEVLRFKMAPDTVFLVGEGFGEDPADVAIFINAKRLPSQQIYLFNDSCVAVLGSAEGWTRPLRGYHEFRVLAKGLYSDPLVGSWPILCTNLAEALLGLSPDSGVLHYNIVMGKAFASSGEPPPADPP
jgi:hypothetical protein